MTESLPRLDETTLRAHLARGAFRRHLGRKWSNPKVVWPFLYLRMTAREIEGMPNGFWLRLDLANYPVDAPTGTFWDMERDAQMENAKRPVLTGSVHQVFRTDWEGGRAFYMACDRVGLQTHPEWRASYPHQAWDPTRDVTHYLNEVSTLLHSAQYTGTPRA